MINTALTEFGQQAERDQFTPYRELAAAAILDAIETLKKSNRKRDLPSEFCDAWEFLAGEGDWNSSRTLLTNIAGISTESLASIADSVERPARAPQPERKTAEPAPKITSQTVTVEHVLVRRVMYRFAPGFTAEIAAGRTSRLRTVTLPEFGLVFEVGSKSVQSQIRRRLAVLITRCLQRKHELDAKEKSHRALLIERIAGVRLVRGGRDEA